MQGIPTIKADGKLFKQEAGVDLSNWFKFGDKNLISVSGMDYRMTEQAEMVGVFRSAGEYFHKDRMMPFGLLVKMTEIPEEIQRVANDQDMNERTDIITVTFSIPIIIERYWEWLEELYYNPNAVEKIEEGTVNFQIHFTPKD